MLEKCCIVVLLFRLCPKVKFMRGHKRTNAVYTIQFDVHRWRQRAYSCRILSFLSSKCRPKMFYLVSIPQLHFYQTQVQVRSLHRPACLVTLSARIYFANQVELCTRFVKFVTWILQSCYNTIQVCAINQSGRGQCFEMVK